MNAEAKQVSAATEKLTTPALEELLRAKYPRDRYALFFDVPDAVSLSAKRRIDAVSVGIWQSVGRDIDGFELKVSRSDWLREVKNVDKADPFIAICDRFWLVTADEKIAKLEEIPACWGWMTATRNGLRVQRPATKLPGTGESVPRNFMLGILRKMQDDLLRGPDVQTYLSERIKAIQDRQAVEIEYAVKRATDSRNELQTAVNEFEKVSGIKIDRWNMGDVGKIVRELRKFGYGSDGLGHVPHVLEMQENALQSALNNVIQVRAQLAQQVASAQSESH